jgi:endo-1,4-beta-xylanase
MGYRVAVTELDVDDSSFLPHEAHRDRLVADLYARFLDAVLPHQPDMVTTWGLFDHYSWLQSARPRVDGLPQRSLPFGRDYRPKPAWQVIRARGLGRGA